MTTNFERIKGLLEPMAKAKLNASTYSVLLYLVWQQFGFPNKDGDQVGYGHLSRELKFSRQTMVTAIQELAARKMLTKDPGRGRYGNTYHIVTDTTRWSNQFNSKADLTSQADFTTSSKADLTTLVKQTLPNNKEETINKTVNKKGYTPTNKNNFLTPKKARDIYGIGEPESKQAKELPPALKAMVQQKEEAIKTLEGRLGGAITPDQHREILNLVDEAMAAGKLAELLAEEVHSGAKTN